jgi:hypothetical protein
MFHVDSWLMAKKKNSAAVQLGKLRMKGLTKTERQDFARQGGIAGGAARAKALTKTERSEIAKKAAAARWGKKSG